MTYTFPIFWLPKQKNHWRPKSIAETTSGNIGTEVLLLRICPDNITVSLYVAINSQETRIKERGNMADPSQSYGGYGTTSSNSTSYGGAGGGYGGSPYSYGGSASAGSSYDTNPYGSPAATRGSDAGLRRRVAGGSSTSEFCDGMNGDDKYSKPQRDVVQRLDFMFPKVDKEFTVQTRGGGIVSLVAYGVLAALCLAEVITWMSQNQSEISHPYVDRSLGKKMRVNMNITFPALACTDLHLDAIDVAGDSQLNIEDTLKKKRLHVNGELYSQQEIDVEMNFHRDQQMKKERVLKEALPNDYCGPCYGAQEKEDQCCQTCDEVLAAYNKKRWKTDLLKFTAEQCIREGRDKREPKKTTVGEGCNLSGYMTVNRVSGNFHIAMGEGIERDGRHIHTYLPEDAPNFNTSHIIHQLSFGPEDGNEPLNGVTKIVTDNTGTTGLFQYFIKIVPTTYVGDGALPKVLNGADSLPSLYEEAEESKEKSKTLETNRYFFTERFMPLMTELLEDHHKDEEDPKKAAVHAGHAGDHSNTDHHMKQNSVLPGIFFIYEIYPFAVEIRKNSVPFTHLFIRLLATIGGVFTLARWADSYIYERGSSSSKRRSENIGR